MEKFTGKERDGESGLDYFGARYYGSALGRFNSPDWSANPQPVPYSKLGNPQSLNLYAYVSNNPLNRFDLDGHYICNGGKQDCTDLREALNTVRDASKSLNLSQEESSKLKKVLDFYGKEGKDNGVTVGFRNGGDPGGTSTENGRTTVTLDLKSIERQFQYRTVSGDVSRTTEPRVEAAAIVAHEGEHGVQQKAAGMPAAEAQEWRGEQDAYRTQGLVDKGLWQNSAWGIWTKEAGWNQEAIDAAADSSTRSWCVGSGLCQ